MLYISEILRLLVSLALDGKIGTTDLKLVVLNRERKVCDEK